MAAPIYLTGQRQLRSNAVDSATVVARGDMLFLYQYSLYDHVKPAADITWNSSLATTQADFAALFLGIAYEASASGETDPISVDVSAESVYYFDVASSAYDIGDPLGPDKASGNALLSQTLEIAAITSSVAQAQEQKTSAVTRLKVSFASAFNPAANNATNPLG